MVSRVYRTDHRPPTQVRWRRQTYQDSLFRDVYLIIKLEMEEKQKSQIKSQDFEQKRQRKKIKQKLLDERQNVIDKKILRFYVLPSYTWWSDLRCKTSPKLHLLYQFHALPRCTCWSNLRCKTSPKAPRPLHQPEEVILGTFLRCIFQHQT